MRLAIRNRKSTNRGVPRSRVAPHPGLQNFAEARRLYRAGKERDLEWASLCFGNWPNPAMFSICSKAPLVRTLPTSRKQADVPSVVLPLKCHESQAIVSVKNSRRMFKQRSTRIPGECFGCDDLMYLGWFCL